MNDQERIRKEILQLLSQATGRSTMQLVESVRRAVKAIGVEGMLRGYLVGMYGKDSLEHLTDEELHDTLDWVLSLDRVTGDEKRPRRVVAIPKRDDQ